MRPGDRVEVLDGEGRVGAASIAEITARDTTLQIVSITCLKEETPRLHLFQALPAGRKIEPALQTCVELGAHAITPFSSRRSRGLGTADPSRMARWRKLALESSRLAGRAYLPVIEEPLTWEKTLKAMRGLDVVIFADETGGDRPCDALRDAVPADLALAIGPEGGFCDEERDDLDAIGALPVTLGGNILRTETAGHVLLAAVRCHYGML
jgi:16S rRNA (uracil1498-N3)-methyltransferase